MAEQIGHSPEEIAVGDGIVLKPVTVGDSAEMHRIISGNPEYFSRYGDSTFLRYQTLERTIASNLEQKETEKRFTIRDDGKLVGFVKVTDIGTNGKGKKVWEIGGWLAPDAQHKGHMTQVVVALTDYAFDTLGADIIAAVVHAENLPSRHVLQRSGYYYSGQSPYARFPEFVMYYLNKNQWGMADKFPLRTAIPWEN